MSLRHIAAAGATLFVLVLVIMAVQMARGHDPALGTTPKPTRHAAVRPQPATTPYQGPLAPPTAEQQAQQQYEQQYQQQQQSQPPPVQSTTS